MFEVVKLHGDFVVVTQDRTKILVDSDLSCMPQSETFVNIADSIQITHGEPSWKSGCAPKVFTSFQEATDCVKCLNEFTLIKTSVTFLRAE